MEYPGGFLLLVMSSLDRAVRIPQAIMSLLKIQIGDHLNARIENGSLILTPENEEPTLESFFATYDGPDYQTLFGTEIAEWENDIPVGNEVLDV